MPFPYTDVELQDAIKTDQVFAAINHGELEKARELARDVISRAPIPEDYEVAYLDGDVVCQRYWDEQDRDFYKALLEMSEDPPQVRWLQCAYPRACFALAFIAVQEGDMTEAVKWLYASAAYDPSQPQPRIEMAIVATHEGDHRLAIDLYDAALEARPVNPPWITARILRGKGFGLIELGRLDEAKAMFEESLTYDPESGLALEEIAYIDRLKAGEQEPVPGNLNITTPGGDVSLPGQGSPGFRRLGGLLQGLRDDGVISAEEFDQAIERLLGEAQTFSTKRLETAETMAGWLRGLAAGFVSGKIAPDEYQSAKADLLDHMCAPQAEAPEAERH